MGDFNVELAFKSLQDAIKDVHARADEQYAQNRQCLDKFSEQMSQIGTTVEVIKVTTKDTKEAVFGNGKKGLKADFIELKAKQVELDRRLDADTTGDLVIGAKLVKLNEKVNKFFYVFLGISGVISVGFTLAINWAKVKIFFNLA